jgi:hypothetical protein
MKQTAHNLGETSALVAVVLLGRVGAFGAVRRRTSALDALCATVVR